MEEYLHHLEFISYLQVLGIMELSKESCPYDPPNMIPSYIRANFPSEGIRGVIDGGEATKGLSARIRVHS